MKIKLFENFTGSRVGKARLLPFKVQSVIDQIELYKLANGIYAVRVKDAKIRCYLFLRYQEFYEGASETIRGNKFTIDQYINWYQDNFKNKDMFTYAYDWCGFNIPSISIEECLDRINDPNEYDRIMEQIFSTIKMDTNDNDFYLLGVDSLDSSLLDHEMAHGMYFTDKDYKNQMDNLTKSLPEETKNELGQIITNMGYNSVVLHDEIQAYMSTGLTELMSKLPNMSDYLSKYKEIFNRYLKKNKHPKEIKIDW